MVERTTVRLPKPLLAAAKKRAAEEGRTVTALIVEGLQKVLREPQPRKPAKMPPVCRESLKSKQPFPMVDLKALDEEEDIERLKKLGMVTAGER
jgi:hypothetical protein